MIGGEEFGGVGLGLVFLWCECFVYVFFGME